MKRSLPKVEIPLKVRCSRLLLVVLVVSMTALAPPATAQENVLRRLWRQIVRGDTGDNASGNVSSGGVRDQFCGSVPASDPTSRADVIAVNQARMVLLALNHDVFQPEAQLTTAALPEFFLYIQPTAALPDNLATKERRLSPSKKNVEESSQPRIDLDDIDALVPENAVQRAEQAEQGQLFLSLEIYGANAAKTYYYSLPRTATLAKITLPDDAPLAVGETYTVNFRFICNRMSLGSLSGATDPQISQTEEGLVFVDVQRVAASQVLERALENSPEANLYQVYLDNGIWVDMVSTLAANPASSEWLALLNGWGIPQEHAVPRPLAPLLDESVSIIQEGAPTDTD